MVLLTDIQDRHHFIGGCASVKCLA